MPRPISSPRQPAPPQTTRLRLLQTTDLHGQLLGQGGIGLAALEPLISQQRADTGLCLLLDTGDFLQGNTLFSNDILNEPTSNDLPLGRDPMIGAFNRLGYDAVALGNHDFASGETALSEALDQATFPVLSSNFTRLPGQSQALPHVVTHIVQQHHITLNGSKVPLKIALLATTPPSSLHCEAPELTSRFHITRMTDAIAAHVPVLKAQGADLVIVLAHTGLSQSQCDPLNDNCALALAQIPGIDALLCGHQHGLFPSPQFANYPGVDLNASTLHGTPAIMPGAFGSHLGQLDLFLHHDGTHWQVHAHQATLFPAPDRKSATTEQPTALHQLAAPYIRRGEAALNQPLGTLAAPLRSYFAQLAPDPIARLLAQLQRDATHDLLQGTAHEGLPLFSAVASQKAPPITDTAPHIDLPPGPFTRRDLECVLPFNNHLCALHLTGAELQEWLHHSAQMFLPIASDTPDAPLLNPQFPAYRFDHLFGAEVQFDLSNPAALPEIRHQNHPLPPEADIIVVTNTHRCTTHPVLSALPPLRRVLPVSPALTDLMRKRLRSPAPLSLTTSPSWRFKPQPGATATVEVATAALPYLADIAQLHPEVLQQTSDSTSSLRLHL